MSFWDRVLVRFRRKRLLYWELRYYEMHGRVIDIEKGGQSIAWRLAMADRTQAENNAAYYRAKLGEADRTGV